MNLSLTKRTIYHWSLSCLILFLFASCQSWDKWDDPSGNQVYPTLQKLVAYSFNDSIGSAFQLSAYTGGSEPSLTYDAELGSKVLHLKGGYAKLNNPLNSVKVQNGVSLTFWMKQPVSSGQSQDLEGALFSFQNETGTQKAFITANGWLNYENSDGEYEDNDPSNNTTNLLTPGEWHYVAISVRNDGYAIYVDGEQKINKEVTEFDFSKVVQFMATSPYLYVGYGSGTNTEEWMLDDLTIYRNQIGSTQIAKPETNGQSGNYIIVGNEDFSTTWWTAFSDMVTMEGNHTMHFGFWNYTNQNANWDNWVLVLTNGKSRTDADYHEYFVLRADAYGWGDSNYSGGNISANYNWDTFKADMQGAYIDLTIKRSTDSRVDITAVVTTKGGTVYNYTFYYEGTMASSIGAFLTCEGAYLAIDPETVYAGQAYSANTYRVGPSDLSAGWWSYFSDFTKISGNTSYPFVYTFYNYTSGNANWNNWLLVVTNGKDRSETGYQEYFVLRADAYGWGDSNYLAGNISASYDWNSFISQMKGAYCKIIITRTGTRVDVTAKVTAADGEQLGDYTFYYEGVSTTDIGTFLTVEGASLDMRTVAYYPFLNLTTESK